MKYTFAACLFPFWSTTIHILCDLPFTILALTSLWSLFYWNGNSFASTICMYAKKNDFWSNSRRWTNSTLNCWAACDLNFFRRFSTNATVPFAVGIFVSCQSGTRDWSRSLSSDGFTHHCFWDRICPKQKRYHIEHRIFRKMLSFRNGIFSLKAGFPKKSSKRLI